MARIRAKIDHKPIEPLDKPIEAVAEEAKSENIFRQRRAVMPVLGYSAEMEQFHPTDLIRFCREAEAAGFGGAMAADPLHPWVAQQGQSAFLWSWTGALGMATQRMTFGPGVTCASYRYHPAIIAQAAATLAAMYPYRFWLGIGTGQALSEHIVGCQLPEAAVRLERLRGSIEHITQRV